MQLVAVKISARVSSNFESPGDGYCNYSVDNCLPEENASDSVEGRSYVSPMKYFTEKVYEPMQQCIASGSFSISSKKALLPVESASD